jgi:hypothetical protein
MVCVNVFKNIRLQGHPDTCNWGLIQSYNSISEMANKPQPTMISLDRWSLYANVVFKTGFVVIHHYLNLMLSIHAHTDMSEDKFDKLHIMFINDKIL